MAVASTMVVASVMVVGDIVAETVVPDLSARADQLLDEGDMAGAETWHRILNAIERLQAKAPAEGKGALTAAPARTLATKR